MQKVLYKKSVIQKVLYLERHINVLYVISKVLYKKCYTRYVLY